LARSRADETGGQKLIGSSPERCLLRARTVGEGASVLWAEGKFDAAIRLEQLWDEVGKTFGVDILCGYALGDFHGEKADVLQSICAEHSSFSVK
jgi:hypothetical protein